MIKMLNIWGWHKCRVGDAIVDETAVLADPIEEEAAQAEEDAAAPEDEAIPARAEAQNAAINVAAAQEKTHAVAPETDCLIRRISSESSSDPSMMLVTSQMDLHAPQAAAPGEDVTQESQAAQLAEDAITDEASSD
jgi:hypothetical protein